MVAEELLAGLPVRRTKYSYDPVGNRLSLEEFRFMSGRWVLRKIIPYSYDAEDRLLQAGDTVFTYDAAGNRRTEVGVNKNFAYTYDAASRLVEVDRGPDQIGYAYDGDGNKVARATNENGPIETIQFLNDVATALPVVLREDGPAIDINYLHALGLVAEETNTAGQVPAVFFYHSDGLGSTVALTDEQGRPRAAYQYDPWGNTEISVGNVQNRFLFTGEERDAGTGLYYLRARWYDPNVGRFVTRDPFAGAVLRPQSLNRFVYAFNNPPRWIDPRGLDPEMEALSAGVKSGLIGGALKTIGAESTAFLIRVLGGLHAEHSVSDPASIGRIFGRISTYVGPFLNIGVTPAMNAYFDAVAHPERDLVERAARYSIDVTAGTLFTLGNIVFPVPIYGPIVGSMYLADRERLQNAILYNPVTDVAGELIYLGETRVRDWTAKMGRWLGIR